MLIKIDDNAGFCFGVVKAIGTAEAVGRENAIDLGDNFIERFTDRGSQLLEGNIDQQLPPEVSWTATAIKENKIYQSYLNQ